VKGRRDREYDRLLTAVRGKGNLVADDPADIGAVLADVNKLLNVDAEKVRIQEALRESKAKVSRLEAELGVIRPQAEALGRKVLKLDRMVEGLVKVNGELLADVKKPDHSAAEVETAVAKARNAEAKQHIAEVQARASIERAAKAEAAIEHAQQHARDAEAAIADAEARAEKAHAEGLKEGKTIAQYAMLAAKQMLAAKNAGRIKALSDDPIPDNAYLVRKAMQIEDRVREELTRKDGE
jgi:Zn-dependent metalloprotease